MKILKSKLKKLKSTRSKPSAPSSSAHTYSFNKTKNKRSEDHYETPHPLSTKFVFSLFLIYFVSKDLYLLIFNKFYNIHTEFQNQTLH